MIRHLIPRLSIGRWGGAALTIFDPAACFAAELRARNN